MKLIKCSCGHEPTLYGTTELPDGTKGDWFQVGCSNCKKHASYAPSPRKAYRKWNQFRKDERNNHRVIDTNYIEVNFYPVGVSRIQWMFMTPYKRLMHQLKMAQAFKCRLILKDGSAIDFRKGDSNIIYRK